MPKPLQRHNIQAIYQIDQPYLFIVLFVHFIHPVSFQVANAVPLFFEAISLHLLSRDLQII